MTADRETITRAERLAAVAKIIEPMREQIRHRANCNGGWWNDPVVWKLEKEIIEPALAALQDGDL